MPSGDGFGQVWRWPLYTPRRFFSCIAVVLALIAVSNMALGGHGSGPPQGQPSGSATSTPTATPESTGTPGDTATSQPSVEPAASGADTPSITPTSSPKPATSDGTAQASVVALKFTRAWANHKRPKKPWLADVSQYANPEFAAQLDAVEPANVPANKVTGQPRAVHAFASSATFEVPTDKKPVIVDLIRDENQAWWVTNIQPKR
jgi:hypothetical protein